MFREMPEEFLRMIVVHELAHIKGAGDKALLPAVPAHGAGLPSVEFELRAYMCHLEATGRVVRA